MAVNINIPKGLDPDAQRALDIRGSFVHGMLLLGHPVNSPAAHENQLVDNALGLRLHTYSPKDLATG